VKSAQLRGVAHIDIEHWTQRTGALGESRTKPRRTAGWGEAEHIQVENQSGNPSRGRVNDFTQGNIGICPAGVVGGWVCLLGRGARDIAVHGDVEWEGIIGRVVLGVEEHGHELEALGIRLDDTVIEAIGKIDEDCLHGRSDDHQ